MIPEVYSLMMKHRKRICGVVDISDEGEEYIFERILDNTLTSFMLIIEVNKNPCCLWKLEYDVARKGICLHTDRYDSPYRPMVYTSYSFKTYVAQSFGSLSSMAVVDRFLLLVDKIKKHGISNNEQPTLPQYVPEPKGGTNYADEELPF